MTRANSTSESTPRIRRRTLFTWGLATMAASWCSRLFISEQESPLVALAKRLNRLTGFDHPSLARLSTDMRHESRLEKLVRGLSGTSDFDSVLSLDDIELRALLRGHIMADYESGRMRPFAGWLLSDTEHHALELSELLLRMGRSQAGS